MKLQEELAKLSCPPGLEDMDEPFTLPAPPTPPAAPPSPPPAPAPAPDPPGGDLDHDMEKIVSQVLTALGTVGQGARFRNSVAIGSILFLFEDDLTQAV